MPARDLFHDKVRVALEKDGWTVTDDPLKLEWEERKLYVDLGAERIFAAEKDERKIAVEIKSFVSLSEVKDLENALGQYFLYLIVLRENEPERKLYLAITEEIFLDFFHEKDLGGFAAKSYNLSIIVFEPEKEEIVKWIN
jgi:hypothetical protein